MGLSCSSPEEPEMRLTIMYLTLRGRTRVWVKRISSQHFCALERQFERHLDSHKALMKKTVEAVLAVSSVRKHATAPVCAWSFGRTEPLHGVGPRLTCCTSLGIVSLDLQLPSDGCGEELSCKKPTRLQACSGRALPFPGIFLPSLRVKSCIPLSSRTNHKSHMKRTVDMRGYQKEHVATLGRGDSAKLRRWGRGKQ